MNPDTLKKHFEKNHVIYMDFSKCSSIQEVLIKIAVHGGGWTPYDWAFFLGCVDFSISDENMLFNSIIETIEETNELDSVITNKTVILNIIEWTRHSGGYAHIHGLLCILACIFKKFPSMWSMNWMYARHKYGRHLRSHRLEFAVPNRHGSYYKSKQFMENFISIYFRPNRLTSTVSAV